MQLRRSIAKRSAVSDLTIKLFEVRGAQLLQTPITLPAGQHSRGFYTPSYPPCPCAKKLDGFA